MGLTTASANLKKADIDKLAQTVYIVICAISVMEAHTLEAYLGKISSCIMTSVLGEDSIHSWRAHASVLKAQATR